VGERATAPARPHGRALAKQLRDVVAKIDRLPVRRGPAYRRLVLDLAELCGGNTRMVGDLLGVSQQAAWETLQRARRDRQRV
jgi:hypothetical protein